MTWYTVVLPCGELAVHTSPRPVTHAVVLECEDPNGWRKYLTWAADNGVLADTPELRAVAAGTATPHRVHWWAPSRIAAQRALLAAAEHAGYPFAATVHLVTAHRRARDVAAAQVAQHTGTTRAHPEGGT